MISVALAAYNGLPYLREQLESVLRQLGPADELVVSDNGSSDGTWDYVEQAARADGRIILLRCPEAPAILANVAWALRHCRGEIVFLCDQDDVWLPGRVRAMTEALEQDPGLLLVQADAELIDGAGRLLAPSFFALRRCGPGRVKNFIRNTYQGCSIAVRRRLLDLALPFPHELPMHDVWLGLLAERYGRVRFLPQVLTQYRRHGANSSPGGRAAWAQVLRWRFCLARALLTQLSHNRHGKGPVQPA